MSDQLILSEKGTPFSREKDAKAAISRRNLSPDYHTVVKYSGGWAIQREVEKIEESRERRKMENIIESPLKSATGYKIVKFNPQSSPNDLRVIPLTVNGLCIRCERDKEVCLPDAYVECAEHAVEKIHTIRPGEPKVSELIHRYPFQIIREATEEEFRRMFKRAGR